MKYSSYVQQYICENVICMYALQFYHTTYWLGLFGRITFSPHNACGLKDKTSEIAINLYMGVHENHTISACVAPQMYATQLLDHCNLTIKQYCLKSPVCLGFIIHYWQLTRRPHLKSKYIVACLSILIKFD